MAGLVIALAVVGLSIAGILVWASFYSRRRFGNG